MPGMQFIGQEPERRNLLAEAMEKGAGGFVKGMEYGQERREKVQTAETEERHWGEEMVLKRDELKHKMATLSHSQIMDSAKLLTDISKMVAKEDPARAREMLEEPEIQAVFEAAGVPLPRPYVEDRPWEGTSWLDRIGAAATPGPTEMEKKRGELRWGGVVSPPVTRTRPATPRSNLLSPQGEGGGKSPYTEYPDAYMDSDGKWKVKRGGQVYRIEEE